MQRVKLWQLCLVLAVCLAGMSEARAALSDQLTVYYTFDNTLNDGSTNANHANWHESGAGAPDGTATYGAGKFGNAALLDGGSEHIQPGSADTPFDYGAGGFTISTWAKVNAFDTTWQALVVKGEGSNMRLHRNGGTNTLAFVAGSGDLGNPANINNGVFHHIVAVHDPSNLNGNGATNRLYIDGVFVSGAAGVVGSNNLPLQIGENPQAPGREWEGFIDDLAIWGRPLTHTEVLQLWNNGDGASLDSLINPPVPEPATAALALLGLTGLGLRRRRRAA